MTALLNYRHYSGGCPQTKHVLHVVQACRHMHQPCCSAHGSGGEGLAAPGPVCDFNTFPFRSEHDRVVTDNITGPDSCKSDGLMIACSRVTLPTVHLTLA